MQEDFKELQLRFIERSVYMMEMLMDLAIARKYGEESWIKSEGFEERFQAAMEEVETLRDQARAQGRVFSFDYLVRRFGLNEIEANILLMALIPPVNPLIMIRR